MTAAVTAEGISKQYGDTIALEDVSLSVDSGDVFALVGPNGAGKTTLVRTLTGTMTPEEGSVTVFGQPPNQVEKERIGLLPQSFAPPERLSARELVVYYAGLYDDPRPVDGVLTDVGLETADETWYTNLSGGQQRRVCVGIALINDPDLLFLDEPTTGIDPAGRQSLWSLITDLADDGTTVFLTTHYMEEAEQLADQVALLDSGSLVEVGQPADLIETYGGGTHLRVETDHSPHQIESLGIDVETTETGLRIPDVAPTEIGEIVSRLEAQGIGYETLTWTEPSLEDVYLRLTSEAIDKQQSSEPAVNPVGESR